MEIKINKLINSKQWVLFILIIGAVVLSSVFIFNYIIDPYGNQNIFCEQKYKPVLNERAKKYRNIFYDKGIKNFDSIILGSSRVMQIVPTNSTFTKNFYNFGIHMANNAEKIFLLKEWLKVKKLKKVYLGIDYFNFNKSHRPLFVDYGKFKDEGHVNYLSLSTLKLSIKSLKNKLRDTPKTFFNNDGSINYVIKDKLIDNNLYDFTDETFKKLAQKDLKKNIDKHIFNEEKKVYEILKEIKKLSIEHDFELVVFITPMHYLLINELENNYKNVVDKYLEIDKKLVQIFGKLYKFNTRNIYNNNTKNFYDNVHYREVIGIKIINVLNGQENDYGKILIKENHSAL